jgi:hypothetical protein
LPVLGGPGVFQGLSKPGDKLTGVDFQRRRHLQDVDEGRIDPASFQVADVGPMQATGVTWVLLAPNQRPPGPLMLLYLSRRSFDGCGFPVDEPMLVSLCEVGVVNQCSFERRGVV